MTQKTTKSNAALKTKVSNAIDKLEAEGKRPTNANVHAITGGSFRDLGPLIKEAKAEREAAALAAHAVPEMPQAVADSLGSVWEAAWRHADETASAERNAHAARVRQLTEEYDELLEGVGIVEGERDAEVDRADRAEAELTALKRELDAQKLYIAHLEGRLAERNAAEAVAAAGNVDEANERTEDDRQLALFPAITFASRPGTAQPPDRSPRLVGVQAGTVRVACKLRTMPSRAKIEAALLGAVTQSSLPPLKLS